MPAHGGWTASLAVALVACNALSGVGDLDFDGTAATGGGPAGGGGSATGGAAGATTATTVASTSSSAGRSATGGGPVTWTFGEGPADHTGVTSDTRIFEQVPTEANGASDSLGIDSDVGGVKVALLRFELSAIPTSATVVAAELRLVTTSGGDCQANPGNGVELQRVLEAWQEGDAVEKPGAANWTERLPGIAWASPGAGPGSTDAAIEAEVAPTALATSYDVVLPLTLVAGWIASPGTNFGLAMKMNPEAAGDGVCLESSESPLAEARPQLAVTFVE